jgi:hypothetical protein
MSRSTALPGLAALLALAGCFQIPVESCQLMCTPEVGCPGDMTCLPQQGLCVSAGVTMCMPSDAGGGSAPPMLCHGSLPCFPLPDPVRANIVLLLWPDSLPTAGSPVTIWRDESGHNNNAYATYPATAPPHVIADGVQLDTTQVGSGFEVQDSPTLDLGSGDFAIIVVAGLSAQSDTITLFAKADGVRTDSRKVMLRYFPTSPSTGVPQGFVDDTELTSTAEISEPSVGVYDLRRTGDHVDVRFNGIPQVSADLPTGISTTNTETLYLGTANIGTYTADTLEAAIIVRGSIASTDLDNLESYLTMLFAMGN